MSLEVTLIELNNYKMAYKLRHKETGLFFCRAKGLANDKRYGELGSREYFLNRHLSKRGRVYEHISEKQKKLYILDYADEFEIFKI